LDPEQLDKVRKLRMRLMEQDEVTADDQRKIDLLTDVINGKSDLPDFAVFTFFADYFRDELQKSVDASRERFPDGTVGEGWAHNIDEAFAVIGSNVIQRAISSWAGDGNRFGLIPLERGVADEFGVPYVENPGLSEAVRTDTDLLYEASPEAWRTAARTIYDNTQAILEAQGITEVLLYRGVGNERTGPFDSPLTSWAVSPNVAQQFAGKKQYQVRVPADRIFGAPMTGLGKSEEAELVLLPSDVPVAEVDRSSTGLPRMFDTWLDYDEDIDDALSAKPVLKANAMQEPVTSDDPSFDDYRMQHQPTYGPGAYNLLDGDMMPDDVYDYPERYGSSGSPAAITEMRQQIEAVRGDRDGLVTVYRSVPPDVAARGDLAWEDGNWVSLSKDYADQHGKSNGGPGWVTMSRQVPAWQVRFAGDDLMEWGWFPNGDRDGDWVTEWGGTPEPVFTSNAMVEQQVDAPTTEPLFRVKGGKWQTSDYLLFDQIEDLTADSVEVLLPGSRPGDAPVPYGDYLFRQDYSGLDLDMKNPAAKLNWTYQDVSVDLTTAAAEMTGVADMPGSGWWSDDVDDATTDDYAKALLDEIREQDLTTMTLWSGQPIRLVFGSAEAGDVVPVPLMALSPSRSVAQSYASGDGRKWIQDPTGNLALQWEQGDEKKRADLATVLADPAIVPLLLGDNRTLRTEPATGTDRNLIVQFATAKVAPIRNFEGITSGQYRVKSVQDVPDPDGLAYWDAEAGEFRHTPARLVTVEFVDDLSVQPLDRQTVEREVLLKSNAMAEVGGLPEGAEDFLARVDRSVQTDRVNRPVSDDWRNTYDARWKFVPEKVRDWALRAGGLQAFDFDTGFDGRDGAQVVAGAQLYVDLIDTETTTDFPLWRGDPYIRGRQVGDTFVEIRGFSADRDTARKFSRGGWVYRVEPGDARVVALDLSSDGSRLTGEKEVVVGGTFEVTAVDPDNKVVTLKQVAALPESELARRLRRSGNTIVEDLEQPAVLSVSEPVLTSNAMRTAPDVDLEAITRPGKPFRWKDTDMSGKPYWVTGTVSRGTVNKRLNALRKVLEEELPELQGRDFTVDYWTDWDEYKAAVTPGPNGYPLARWEPENNRVVISPSIALRWFYEDGTGSTDTRTVMHELVHAASPQTVPNSGPEPVLEEAMAEILSLDIANRRIADFGRVTNTEGESGLQRLARDIAYHDRVASVIMNAASEVGWDRDAVMARLMEWRAEGSYAPHFKRFEYRSDGLSPEQALEERRTAINKQYDDLIARLPEYADEYERTRQKELQNLADDPPGASWEAQARQRWDESVAAATAAGVDLSAIVHDFTDNEYWYETTKTREEASVIDTTASSLVYWLLGGEPTGPAGTAVGETVPV
jgi:hypothetical protein